MPIYTHALSQLAHPRESQQVAVVFSLPAGIRKKGVMQLRDVYMTTDRPMLHSRVCWQNQECEGP